MPFNLSRTTAIALSVGLLIGDAAAQTAPVAAIPRAPRIVVVEVPIAHAVKRLRLVSSEPRPKDRAEERALIARTLRAAEEEAKASIAESFAWNGDFIVESTAAARSAIGSADLADDDRPLPLDRLEPLREAGVDAVLRFRMTDYGRTPRKVMKWIYLGTGAWVAGVITFAALNAQTRPFIGAYIATEVLQESAELYLGTSFFGHEYKPVRIEAELIDTRTGRILWEDAKTRTASKKYLRMYPKAERTKELELAVSVDRAVLELARSAAARVLGKKRPAID